MIILSSILSTGLVFFDSVNSYAEIIENEECLPAILMLRGSGEALADGTIDGEKIYSNKSNSTSYIKTNGAEGEKISKLIQPFVDDTDPSQTVSKARFIGIDYPALPVFPDYDKDDSALTVALKSTHHFVKYPKSYHQGAKNIVEFIKSEEERGCQTQYMLVGYSQGVISVRLALNLLDNNKEKIVSTYVIGDPVNKGDVLLTNRQASPAHASSDLDGSVRTGLNTFKKLQFGAVKDTTDSYLKSMTNSDEIIYRDNIEEGIYSRTICHDQDIVCDLDGNSSITNHNNYFTKRDNPDAPWTLGDTDLQYEIEAFDEQVKVLVNSAPGTVKKRSLKKTPSVNTSSTLYNLANAKTGDKCSWDEGNDGTYETVNVDCGIYEYENNSQLEKMKVKVTDSFGSDYFFELEDEVLEVEQLEAILHLYPNSWYQFKVKEMPLTEKDKGKGWYYDYFEERKVFDKDWKPSFTGDQCIEWSIYPDREIDVDYWNTNLNSCRYELKDNNAYDALQSFKPSMSANGYDRQMVAGYDDNYAWDIDDLYENMAIVPKENSTHDFYPLLTEVVDNKAYYSFRTGDKCLTALDNDAGHTNLDIQECVYSDNQLFEAIKTDGQYGALSVERDNVNPNAPSKFLLEMINNTGYVSTLSWDKIQDRGLDVRYEIWQLNKDTYEYELLDDVGEDEGTRSYDIQDPLIAGKHYSYAIRSVDISGNYSEYAYFDFNFPSKVKKPTKPVLESVATDGASVTLTLPTYTSSDIRGVQVYDKTEYLGTFMGSSVTLDTESNTTHNYSYKFEINESIVSISSNKLKVVIP